MSAYEEDELDELIDDLKELYRQNIEFLSSDNKEYSEKAIKKFIKLTSSLKKYIQSLKIRKKIF